MRTPEGSRDPSAAAACVPRAAAAVLWRVVHQLIYDELSGPVILSYGY
jgi:hypothetical protein